MNDTTFRPRGSAAAIEALLRKHDIVLDDLTPGNHYVICPQCAHGRKKAHQAQKKLCVRIDDRGCCWHCNHCDWSGPERDDGGSIANYTIHPYHDDDHKFLYAKWRFPKGSEPRCLWKRKDANGKWFNGKGDGKPRVLYRLPQILAAIKAGQTILIVEGESDADALWAIGIPATCSQHGAAEPGKTPKWTAEDSEWLRDADCVVFSDHDPPGYAHQHVTCELTVKVARRVRVVKLAEHWPDCPPGGDIRDWLNAGQTREELLKLIETALDWVPSSPTGGDDVTNKIVEAIEIKAGHIETYKVSLIGGGTVVVGAQELNFFPYFNRACIAMARRSFQQPDEGRENWWAQQVDNALRAAKPPENPAEEVACWHGSPEWKDNPPSWLIRERIPEQGVGLLSGQFSMFKSFVLLDASASIMTGLPWLKARVVRRGGVLIFAAEGAADIPMRMAALIEHKLQRMMKDAPGIDLFNHQGIDLKHLPLTYIPSCRPLLDPNTAEWIIEKACAAQDKLKREFGLDLVLIGIDTMSAAAGWESENDSAQVQTVLNHMADVSKATGAFVLAADHFGKDQSQKSRGSSVKEASANTIMDVLGEKSEDGNVNDTRLVLRKQRSGPQGMTFPFEARLVDMGFDRDNEPLTSRVIRWNVTRPEKVKVKPRSQSLLEQVVTSALAEHGEEIEVQDTNSGELQKVRAVRKDTVRFAFKTAYQVDHPTANADAVGEAFRRALRQANLIVKTHIVDGDEYLTATPI